jgi:hypothetical protein
MSSVLRVGLTLAVLFGCRKADAHDCQLGVETSGTANRAAASSNSGIDRLQFSAPGQPFAACGKLMSKYSETSRGISQENMPISGFKTVLSIFDEKVARSLAVLFQDEMIPAEVIGNGAPLRWEIQVPSEFLEQALRLYEQWKPSDVELSYLATGTLGNGHDSG